MVFHNALASIRSIILSSQGSLAVSINAIMYVSQRSRVLTKSITFPTLDSIRAPEGMATKVNHQPSTTRSQVSRVVLECSFVRTTHFLCTNQLLALHCCVTKRWGVFFFSHRRRQRWRWRRRRRLTQQQKRRLIAASLECECINLSRHTWSSSNSSSRVAAWCVDATEFYSYTAQIECGWCSEGVHVHVCMSTVLYINTITVLCVWESPVRWNSVHEK